MNKRHDVVGVVGNLFAIVLVFIFLSGWVLNLYKLSSGPEEWDTEDFFRLTGVVVLPLGAIAGYVPDGDY